MKIKDAQYYLATIRDKKYTEQEKQFKLYEFFKGKDKSKKATVKDVHQHTALLNSTFAEGELPEFDRVIKIKNPNKRKWWQFWIKRNLRYGLEPSINDMEGGAFFDLDSLVHKDIDQNLHKILAVLYRPIIMKIGSRYEISSYVEEKEQDRLDREYLFLHEFDYHKALGLVDFFWSSTLSYTKS